MKNETLKKSVKSMITAIFMASVALTASAQNDIPRPHIEPVITHPTKIVLTPAQLDTLVKDHHLIGKQLVKDCFDSTVGHICLDEIVSYLGKDKEDYVEFRIVKFNQTPIPDSYPYRVSIYLDKDSKIKVVKIQ